MHILHYIAVDPAICHGQPHFKGTRVLVHAVLALLAAGIKPEEIVGETYYPMLTREHILAALAYAARVTEVGELVPLAAAQ